MPGIAKVQQDTNPLVEKITGLRESGQRAEAVALLNGEAKAAFIEWLRVINVFIDMEEAMNKSETADARGIVDNFLMMMGLLLLAAVASGSAQIAANIGDVATVARNTTALVHQTEQTVGELSQVTGELRTLVSRFRF